MSVISVIFHRFLVFFIYWFQYAFYIYLNYFEDNKCIISHLFNIILMQTEKATSKQLIIYVYYP